MLNYKLSKVLFKVKVGKYSAIFNYFYQKCLAMKKYNVIEAAPILLNLNDWHFNSDGIEKKFQFKNFTEALSFIVKVGVISEKSNHHPELFNVYNKVNIRLTTHDAGGVTDKDFKLASEIDAFL